MGTTGVTTPHPWWHQCASPRTGLRAGWRGSWRAQGAPCPPAWPSQTAGHCGLSETKTKSTTRGPLGAPTPPSLAPELPTGEGLVSWPEQRLSHVLEGLRRVPGRQGGALLYSVETSSLLLGITVSCAEEAHLGWSRKALQRAAAEEDTPGLDTAWTRGGGVLIRVSGDRVDSTALVHLAHGCPRVCIHASRGQALLQLQPALPSLSLGSGQGPEPAPFPVEPKASPVAAPAPTSKSAPKGNLCPKSSPGLDTQKALGPSSLGGGTKGPGGLLLLAPGGCPDDVAMLSLGVQSCGCFPHHTPLLPLPGQQAVPLHNPPRSLGAACWPELVVSLPTPNPPSPGPSFWAPKITADGDCSHEIIRCLLLGRKAMTNLDSILKSRDNSLPKKVCLVKAMVFLVVMYGCESWL